MERFEESPLTLKPLISVIIINFNGGNDLLHCIASIRSQEVPCEILVVDNDSHDGSCQEAMKRFTGLRIVALQENLGFAGGANAGARVARGEFLLFVNPDSKVCDGAIREIIHEFDTARVGVVGPVLRHGASHATDFGSAIDLLGYPIGLGVPGQPVYVSGCALATRRDLFAQLGGFDERFFMFVEDVDYCVRILLSGRDVRVSKSALVEHVGGASAPGGYFSESSAETSRFRVALRERNTFAMLLKCMSPLTLMWLIPLYLLQSVATALLLAARGKFRTAVDVFGGLAWNIRNMNGTLGRRRVIQRLRTVPDRVVRSRMHKGLVKVSLLRQFGIPEVSESHN